jgi:hypothetical protein
MQQLPLRMLSIFEDPTADASKLVEFHQISIFVIYLALKVLERYAVIVIKHFSSTNYENVYVVNFNQF